MGSPQGSGSRRSKNLRKFQSVEKNETVTFGEGAKDEEMTVTAWQASPYDEMVQNMTSVTKQKSILRQEGLSNEDQQFDTQMEEFNNSQMRRKRHERQKRNTINGTSSAEQSKG